MALSKEYDEFHLTPSGWRQGTVKSDNETRFVRPPNDRVLTYQYGDCTPCMGAEPYHTKRLVFGSEKGVENLFQQFGADPSGYEDWVNK